MAQMSDCSCNNFPGNVTFGGSAGIGVSSGGTPATALEVTGGAALIQGHRMEALFTFANSNSTAGIGIQNSGGAHTGTETDLSFLMNASAGQALVAQVTSTMQDVSSSYTSDMALKTAIGGSLATRLYVDSNGRVGIGTTSPAVPLHVTGGAVLVQNYRMEAVFTHANTNSTSGIGIENSGAAHVGTEAEVSFLMNAGPGQVLPSQISTSMQDVSASFASDLSLKTSVAGTLGTRLYIDSAGRVGLGTTTPAQELDVNGSINCSGVVLNGSIQGSSGPVVDSGGCYYAS